MHEIICMFVNLRYCYSSTVLWFLSDSVHKYLCVVPVMIRPTESLTNVYLVVFFFIDFSWHIRVKRRIFILEYAGGFIGDSVLPMELGI